MLASNLFLNNIFNNLVEQSYYWNIVLCSFRYVGNWQLLSNIMGFVVVSIFLERHCGSLKYLFLLLLIIPLANLTTFAFVSSWDWGGFSGVVYFLYASVLLNLIFNFKSYFVGKIKWLFPIIIIAGIVIMMSLDWGGNGISDVKIVLFKRFTNIGLMGPFITGIVVGLYSRIFAYKHKKANSNKNSEITEKKETEKETEIDTQPAKKKKSKKHTKSNKKNEVSEDKHVTEKKDSTEDVNVDEKKDATEDVHTAEKKMLSENEFLLDCCRIAKQLNSNGEDFTISELVHKVVQDQDDATQYINVYGEKIYSTLKEGIKNHNLSAKILLVKRGDIIVYEKIKFAKI